MTDRFEESAGDELQQLLSCCLAEDPRAWRSLLASARRLALQLARWKYRLDPDDAEDVAQIVQIRLRERLPQLREADAFPSWVRRLVHHAVIDQLRKRRSHLSLEELVAHGGEPEAEHEADAMADTVVRLDLGRALARLPQHYREPIQMHFLQGLPQDEVGRLLGRPRSTVASQIDRGLRKLQRALSGEYA